MKIELGKPIKEETLLAIEEAMSDCERKLNATQEEIEFRLYVVDGMLSIKMDPR